MVWEVKAQTLPLIVVMEPDQVMWLTQQAKSAFLRIPSPMVPVVCCLFITDKRKVGDIMHKSSKIQPSI